MRRAAGVRYSDGVGPLIGHPIVMEAPALALLLESAIVGHVLPRTRGTYESAIRNVESFMAAFSSRAPFPVDPVWLCAWLVYVSMDVSHASLKVYICGIKYGQGSLGFAWPTSGAEYIRRVMRYLKRKYGMAGKATKVALSISLLLRLFGRMPGWPILENMSHDDRVVAASSTVATLGFLRGGEFLWSRGSDRALLRGRDVVVSRRGAPAVVVSVPQPKTRFWLAAVDVVCFVPEAGCPFDPVWLVSRMRQLAPVSMGPDDAAFRMADGRPLSRDVAVRRIGQLLSLAGVSFVDRRGEPADVKAASWRAGGVASARAALIPDSVIMELGRWSTYAWLAYSVTELSELRGAMAAMWSVAGANSAGAPLVGVVPPAAVGDALMGEVALAVLHNRVAGPSVYVRPAAGHRRAL